MGVILVPSENDRARSDLDGGDCVHAIVGQVDGRAVVGDASRMDEADELVDAARLDERPLDAAHDEVELGVGVEYVCEHDDAPGLTTLTAVAM